jgi:hypothetical protein
MNQAPWQKPHVESYLSWTLLERSIREETTVGDDDGYHNDAHNFVNLKGRAYPDVSAYGSNYYVQLAGRYLFILDTILLPTTL